MANEVTTPNPIASPTSVRVHVHRDNEGYIQVDSIHDLPNPRAVMRYLPKEYLKQIDKWTRRHSARTLNHLINTYSETIPLQVWSDAIGQAIMEMIACSAPNAETELQHIAHGGYLAIGDSLYKLSAIGMIKTNRAMSPIRKRIIEAAKVEADGIKSAANLAAEAVLADAERMKTEAAAILRRANVNNTPPEWLASSGIPIAFNALIPHPNWKIGLRLSIGFTKFIYNWTDGIDSLVAEWPVPDDLLGKPLIKTLCWVPVSSDGTYTVTTIHVDIGSQVLPHMTYNAACMELGDAPRRLTSLRDVNNLIGSIQRCFQVVNLSSLHSDPSQWRDAFKDYIPEVLRQAISGPHNLDIYRRLAETQHIAATVDHNQEARETWRV